jgi:hypothetical protein
MFYEIKVHGKVNTSWSDWFNGMQITHTVKEDGQIVTVLSGLVVDQTALHGLLGKIRDLGVKLISVERITNEN